MRICKQKEKIRPRTDLLFFLLDDSCTAADYTDFYDLIFAPVYMSHMPPAIKRIPQIEKSASIEPVGLRKMQMPAARVRIGRINTGIT